MHCSVSQDEKWYERKSGGCNLSKKQSAETDSKHLRLRYLRRALLNISGCKCGAAGYCFYAIAVGFRAEGGSVVFSSRIWKFLTTTDAFSFRILNFIVITDTFRRRLHCDLRMRLQILTDFIRGRLIENEEYTDGYTVISTY